MKLSLPPLGLLRGPSQGGYPAGWRGQGLILQERGPREPAVLCLDPRDPSHISAGRSVLNNHTNRETNELPVDPLIQPGLGTWQRPQSLIKGIPRRAWCLCIWFCIYTLGTSEEAAGECLSQLGGRVTQPGIHTRPHACDAFIHSLIHSLFPSLLSRHVVINSSAPSMFPGVSQALLTVEPSVSVVASHEVGDQGSNNVNRN